MPSREAGERSRRTHHTDSVRVELSAAASRTSPLRCAYCHDALTSPGAARACPACRAAHHDECWSELGRCATCNVSAAGVRPLHVERRARRLAEALATHGAPAGLTLERGAAGEVTLAEDGLSPAWAAAFAAHATFFAALVGLLAAGKAVACFACPLVPAVVASLAFLLTKPRNRRRFRLVLAPEHALLALGRDHLLASAGPGAFVRLDPSPRLGATDLVVVGTPRQQIEVPVSLSGPDRARLRSLIQAWSG